MNILDDESSFPFINICHLLLLNSRDSDDGETNKVDYQDNDGYASKCIEQNIQGDSFSCTA